MNEKQRKRFEGMTHLEPVAIGEPERTPCQIKVGCIYDGRILQRNTLVLLGKKAAEYLTANGYAEQIAPEFAGYSPEWVRAEPWH